MNILILNPILYTPNNNIIPQVKSIKDTMIYNMCLGFKQLGHTITLGAALEYKPVTPEEYDFEIIFLKSDFTKICQPSVLPFSKQLWRFLKEHHNNFDCIIASEAFSFQALFCSFVCPKKTIIWHELALHQKKFHHIPSYLWYNLICRILYKNITIAPRSRKAYDFIRKYCKKVSSTTIEHGINIDMFTPQKNKKRQFIIVSQLIKRKNIFSIIEKFKKLIKDKDYKDYMLYIIGDGPLKQDINNYINFKSNIGDNVKLEGFKRHEELKEILADSMGLLINTLQDNNMVSIPESIACGTPVITNTIPTNSDLIQEQKLGIVNDNWNEVDLKEIIANNEVYVNNCIAYRDKLTNKYIANKLVQVFNNSTFYENSPRQ